MALLLTLPAGLPHLAVIRALVLGTVMASLLVEGTTLPLLAGRLGLLDEQPAADACDGAPETA